MTRPTPGEKGGTGPSPGSKYHRTSTHSPDRSNARALFTLPTHGGAPEGRSPEGRAGQIGGYTSSHTTGAARGSDTGRNNSLLFATVRGAGAFALGTHKHSAARLGSQAHAKSCSPLRTRFVFLHNF